MPFTGARSPNGTGRFKIAARTEIRAHRFAWEQVHGPVPAGVRLINRCGLMSCCNVGHWAIGDTADAALVRAAAEARRTAAHVRSKRGRRLTPAQVWAIRGCYRETGLTQREIGAMFGVRQSTVSMICSGRLHGGLVEPVAAVVPIAAAPRSLPPTRLLPAQALSYPPIR